MQSLKHNSIQGGSNKEEMKMYEMRLKQKELAKKLNVSDAKLSLIMNGKQKPDINFLKAVHLQLNISGDYLLKVV